VNRETIRECEKIGLTLEEFVEISLGAMQGIAERLGL
jgi:predicted hydrolase (HD superfamily)